VGSEPVGGRIQVADDGNTGRPQLLAGGGHVILSDSDGRAGGTALVRDAMKAASRTAPAAVIQDFAVCGERKNDARPFLPATPAQQEAAR
jgi:hypothetical protein